MLLLSGGIHFEWADSLIGLPSQQHKDPIWSWWKNGALHRSDGPATRLSSDPMGVGVYFFEGKFYGGPLSGIPPESNRPPGSDWGPR